MIILGFLILIFAMGCFVASFIYFLKYLYYYRKSDKDYTNFLTWFNREYKDYL